MAKSIKLSNDTYIDEEGVIDRITGLTLKDKHSIVHGTRSQWSSIEIITESKLSKNALIIAYSSLNGYNISLLYNSTCKTLVEQGIRCGISSNILQAWNILEGSAEITCYVIYM